MHTPVPRFLLNGFTSRKCGDETFVWLCRRGGTAIEVNTKNVNVVTDFYGKDADDKITEIEGRLFAPLIRNLRANPRSTSVQDPTLPSLIAHLCARTRNIRESLMKVADAMLQGLRDELTEPGTLKTAILNSDVLKEKLTSLLIERGAPRSRMKEARQLIQSQLSLLPEHRFRDSTAIVDQRIAEMRAVFPEAMRTAHNEALSRNPTATKRADSYERFCWFIATTKSPVILGDSACVFEIDGPRFKTLTDQADDVKRVILPVSSDRVLIGTLDSSCPEAEEHLLNQAFARCSHECFVSSVPNPLGSDLVNSIGEWSGVLSPDEVRRIIDDLKTEWLVPQ